MLYAVNGADISSSSDKTRLSTTELISRLTRSSFSFSPRYIDATQTFGEVTRPRLALGLARVTRNNIYLCLELNYKFAIIL